MALHTLHTLHTLRGLARLRNGVTRVSILTAQRAARGSCAGGGEQVPACAPCPPRAPPACRATSRAPLRGVRVACRAPPRGSPPPCAGAAPPRALTCDHRAQNTSAPSAAPAATAPAAGHKAEARVVSGKRCGDSLDRVARRIAAAKHSRRVDYEREAARGAQRGARAGSAAHPPPAVYRLGADREVVRATDGRDYVVLPPLPAAQEHSHPQTARAAHPRTVELDSAEGCAISRSPSADPCAHEPRVILEIDRSEITESSASKCTRGQGNGNKVSVPKKLCKSSGSGALSNWCSSPPSVEPEPARCRQQTLLDKIKLRPKSSCDGVRKLHTATVRCQCRIESASESDVQAVVAAVDADKEKFTKMLKEKSELKEAGRGRVAVLEHDAESMSGGQLELAVPGGARAVRVRLTLLGAGARRAAGGRRADEPRRSYSDKCDPWLSIKNIQKKLSACRKDSSAAENAKSQKPQCPPAADMKPYTGASPCKSKQAPQATPCGQNQTNQKSTSRPCNTNSPVKPQPCSSTMKFLPNNIILL